MLIDPDYGLHVSRPDGAQALYRAAIARSVLDLFGKESIAGWGFGYATMGALGILGALAVAVTASRRPTPANQR